MTVYRIAIDRSRCGGFGTCVEEAPGVFSLDPDGFAVAPPETDDGACLDAAAACPMRAIAVEAADGRRAA